MKIDMQILKQLHVGIYADEQNNLHLIERHGKPYAFTFCTKHVPQPRHTIEATEELFSQIQCKTCFKTCYTMFTLPSVKLLVRERHENKRQRGEG